MAEVKTVKEKYFKWVIVILVAVVLVLIWIKRITFNQIILIGVMAAVVAYFLLRKTPATDIYKAAEIISVRHFKHTGEHLDITNLEAAEFPEGSGRLRISFKNNARTFHYFNDMILGTQIKEITAITRDLDRSRLTEGLSKQVNLNEQIKKGLERFNIDPSTYGLE